MIHESKHLRNNKLPSVGSIVKFTVNSYPDTVGKIGLVIKKHKRDKLNNVSGMIEVFCDGKSVFIDTGWKQSFFYEVIE